VLDENRHVLFIVPTKRLLQNLIRDARAQARDHLFSKRCWDETRIGRWIETRIIEWSGNQTDDGRQGRIGMRTRQLLSDVSMAEGRIIFAIPEVVLGMISGLRVAGAGSINPFLWPRRFDHIVFDEFHTIDDRSFGLACLFSLLAVDERKGMVSLLSATPLDITNVLEKMGIETNDIDKIDETIVDGHTPNSRPIHGNVMISHHNNSLADLIRANVDAVRASVHGGYKVIAIYDSLERLKKERSGILKTWADAGLPRNRVLEINSIDDSERKLGEAVDRDPSNYDLLICTASVEVGVTFRSNLMFIEPGFGVSSFIQRVGRVARGPEEGKVLVSLPDQSRRRHPWVRRIAQIVEQNDELHIQEFTRHLLCDQRRRLVPTSGEADANPASQDTSIAFYRRTSWRGVYWAALFLVAIRRTKMKVQKEASKRLDRISPNIVKFVDAKIGEILSVEMVHDNRPRRSQPHIQWVNALLASALVYRDIGASIVVVDPNGTRHTVSESFLRRSTDILSRYIEFDEDGERVIRLMRRSLNDEIEMSSECPNFHRMKMKLFIRSPIGGEGFSLSIVEYEKGAERIYAQLVEKWWDQFSAFIPLQEQDRKDPRKVVIGAATALVEKLGRPPLDEDYEDSEESALFA